MTVFVVTLAIVSACIAAAMKLVRGLRRLSSRSCSTIIREMRYVDLAVIHAVAHRQGTLQLQHPATTEELISQLGGAAALERMHKNANALMDLARYLTMINPEADEIAGVIRRDAAIIVRISRILRWRGRLRLFGLTVQPLQVCSLSICYARVSRNSLTLCNSLVDEVLPLLQEVSNVQARMLRVHVAVSTSELEAAQPTA